MFNDETAIFQLYHGENKLQSYHHDDVRKTMTLEVVALSLSTQY
jgi:hypothetical protein